MNSSKSKFPNTLVLPFTSLYPNVNCRSTKLAEQLIQGNTFSVPFDMTHAPHAPGESGFVYLKTDRESNFMAAQKLELANEGLSDKIAFMSTGQTQAMIFGHEYIVTRVFLVGVPNGDVFTWQTGIIIDDTCAVTNRTFDEVLLKRLLQ
jgi:hypothetical protein